MVKIEDGKYLVFVCLMIDIEFGVIVGIVIEVWFG